MFSFNVDAYTLTSDNSTYWFWSLINNAKWAALLTPVFQKQSIFLSKLESRPVMIEIKLDTLFILEFHLYIYDF